MPAVREIRKTMGDKANLFSKHSVTMGMQLPTGPLSRVVLVWSCGF